MAQQTDGQPPSRFPWPPVLFTLALGLGLWAHYLWPIPLWPGRPTWIAGVAMLAGSLCVTFWAHDVLAKAKTTIRPDRATSALVTSGPFSWSRNPLYLAMCGAALSASLFVNGVAPAATAAILWTALNSFVIPREEHHLATRFPGEFAAYRARVRRWL